MKKSVKPFAIIRYKQGFHPIASNKILFNSLFQRGLINIAIFNIERLFGLELENV